MTRRAWAFLLCGAALSALGWSVNWPEVTGLGAGSILLTLLVLALSRPRGRGELELLAPELRVTRGDPVSVRLTVTAARRPRALRIVEGPVDDPRSTSRLPSTRRGASVRVAVPVDTSERGVRPVGPYSLVHGDPWGLVRRVVSVAEGGLLTVHPRVHPVRRDLTATRTTGDSDNASRRQGDQHFHALREYVFGDEPRNVHWRSSARAGHLVVRQHVSAASIGTVVVLDTDLSAYAGGGAFAGAWDRDRFELAVEAAASLATGRLTSVEQVQLALTTRASTPVHARAGQTTQVLDVLAAVDAVTPVECAPEELPAIVRRARCAHLVVVTGTPSARTAAVVRGLSRLVPSTVVVRIGDQSVQPGFTGIRVVDVVAPEDLA